MHCVILGFVGGWMCWLFFYKTSGYRRWPLEAGRDDAASAMLVEFLPPGFSPGWAWCDEQPGGALLSLVPGAALATRVRGLTAHRCRFPPSSAMAAGRAMPRCCAVSFSRALRGFSFFFSFLLVSVGFPGARSVGGERRF